MCRCGEVAFIGSMQERLHAVEFDGAGIVLDQASDANGLFGGPVNLILRKAELFQRTGDFHFLAEKFDPQ